MILGSSVFRNWNFDGCFGKRDVGPNNLVIVYRWRRNLLNRSQLGKGLVVDLVCRSGESKSLRYPNQREFFFRMIFIRSLDQARRPRGGDFMTEYGKPQWRLYWVCPGVFSDWSMKWTCLYLVSTLNVNWSRTLVEKISGSSWYDYQNEVFKTSESSFLLRQDFHKIFTRVYKLGSSHGQLIFIIVFFLQCAIESKQEISRVGKYCRLLSLAVGCRLFNA